MKSTEMCSRILKLTLPTINGATSNQPPDYSNKLVAGPLFSQNNLCTISANVARQLKVTSMQVIVNILKTSQCTT